MHLRHFSYPLALVALIAPIKAIKTKFNATFDDLQGGAVAGTAPLGIYEGLSYQDFSVSDPGLANESLAVSPESRPNIAIGLTSGASSVSIAYPSSKVKNFGLDSFYYGCNTALKNGEVEVAVSCNITVLGYKAGSTKPVANQTFEFNPSLLGILASPPAFGMFSSIFQGLKYANFTITPSTLVVFLIDNLVGSTVSDGTGGTISHIVKKEI